MSLEPEYDLLHERFQRVLEEAPIHSKEYIIQCFQEFESLHKRYENNLRKKTRVSQNANDLLDQFEEQNQKSAFFRLENEDDSKGGLLS